ncbi:HCL319Cp [Eremothecium sinecaudum]|uniref:HCL319Cp n=1 Tax=Eremothecium sinecaudum TaxID=45286 RepID=A0A120K1X6_9SACH|nr:HCL319Cp [Eremothecium sinecaudum]AMD19832.1 HCL319Cp [Eremothecium sinecaudum]
MSSTLINRSLTNIKTELEFLTESGVISQKQYKEILEKLPDPNARNPPPLPRASSSEYVIALYAFQAQQEGDLTFNAGDKIEVLEKLTPEWYKGRHNGNVGMFPSNYVKPAFSSPAPPAKEESLPPPEYKPTSIVPTNHPAPTYGQSPLPPSAAGYYQHPPQGQYQPPAQYPPPGQYQQPPIQYAQPAPVQPVVQQGQSGGGSSTLKNIGTQLGTAAIFGAGATIGSDIVHSIF